MTKMNRWKRVQKKRKKVKRLGRMLHTDIVTHTTAELGGAPMRAREPGDEGSDTQTAVVAKKRKKSSEANTWRQFGFDEQILKGVQKAGYEEPTRVQLETIPHILRGSDVLATSATGSGKTAAFLLPMLQRLSRHDEEKSTRALLLSPTRELAMQTLNFIKQLGHYTNIRSVELIGGMSQEKQERLLKRKPDVIVATPGRLWALMREGFGELIDLSDMELLVVDEVDRMLEKGHFEELGQIINWIHSEPSNEFEPPVFAERREEPPKKRSKKKGGKKPKAPSLRQALQTLVFSATLTFTHNTPLPVATASLKKKNDGGESMQFLKAKLARMVSAMHVRPSRVVIDLTEAQRTPQSLREYRMHCTNLLHKDTNLYYLLKRYEERVLLFANSVDAIRRLYSVLNKLGLKPLMLHARMQEQRRLKNLEKFAEQPNSLLLATDVAARGLDIQGVGCVIHYQVPRTAEIYLHRSGRTARALKEGKSILFVDPGDIQPYQKIRHSLAKGTELSLLVPDYKPLFSACQERMHLAMDYESAEFALKKDSMRREWFVKAAEEADIVLDEDDDDGDELPGGKSDRWRQLAGKKKSAQQKLERLLEIPLPTVPASSAKMEDEPSHEPSLKRKRKKQNKGKDKSLDF